MAGAANDPNDRPQGQLTPEATRMALALSLVFLICIFATAFAARRYMLGSGIGITTTRWRQHQRHLRGDSNNDGHIIFGESHRAAELAAVYGSTRDRLDELERRRQRRREGMRQRKGLRMEDVERFEIVTFRVNDGIGITESEARNAQETNTPTVFVETLPLPASDLSPAQDLRQEQQKDQLGKFPILSRIATLARTQDRSRIMSAIRGAVISSVENDGTGFCECSICTDDFAEGMRLRRLPCGHMFHPGCIDPWLRERARTCPLCRLDLEAHLSRIDAAKRDAILKEPQRAKLPLEAV